MTARSTRQRFRSRPARLALALAFACLLAAAPGAAQEKPVSPDPPRTSA
ncbi:MAG: hypothetical protein ABIS51_08245 [Sphingomonas sp.]